MKHDLPATLRSRVQKHLLALARECCRAAGYSLSGDHPWPKLCSKHIDGWRVIVAFPDDSTVAVVSVAPHTDQVDPYADLAAIGGFEVSEGPRTKPACCDDGVPPIDTELVSRIEEGLKRLRGQ
jgi:hypothetical protein